MRQRTIFALLIASIAIPLLAYAGTLTMATYYPAPTGNYDQLTANNIGVGTVRVGGELFVSGEGTGYAHIGNSHCGDSYTGISLHGVMTACKDYNLLSDSADLYINRVISGKIYIRENNQTQMYLAGSTTGDGSGNVSIGNTAPTAKLDVTGDISLSSATPKLNLGGTTTFLYYPSANTLTFHTNNAERMRLDANGNLGIGMTNPTNTLDVTGNARVSGTTSLAVANITTDNITTANITTATVTTGNITTANITTAAIANNATVGGTLSVTGTTTLATTTINNAATIGTGLTITAGGETITAGNLVVAAGSSTLQGNVGIGAGPNPLFKLYVTGGDLGVDGNIYNTSGGYYYGAPSDKRLKENIHAIKDPIAKVKALNGVTFDWKKNKKHSVGVIAQDVEKVFPELVFENKEGSKFVAYQNLVGVLIEAVKEQQKQIDTLKKEVAALHKKIK